MDTLLHQMGERIMARRKQLRWTQEELAEAAGVTPQTISTAELGKKALRPVNIINICAALDISPDYLLLGRISGEDISILSQKVSQLSPGQYRHLEDVVDSFIAVAIPNENKA
ncbi:MAG: helix-turn-helix transcriptional regulator [Lawsonibacter sp.]|nr:helix-turn-helix transcriptional regulator [Lawsonibacter sp.]